MPSSSKNGRFSSASIMSLCTPAIIYFVLGIISITIIVLQKSSAINLLFEIFSIALLTWFLNYLCKKGYSNVSWFFVLLPYILLFAVLVNYWFKY